MKRGTRHHTKTNRLMRALRCNRAMATGILESLWHVTSAESPAGDIGKLSDEDIADAIDCGYGADQLIPALVSAGWLDADPVHRLIVHDWHDHADDATKKRVERGKQPWASESVRQRRTTADNGGKCPPALPVPEPEPVPEPVPESVALPPRAATTDRPSADSFEAMTRLAKRDLSSGEKNQWAREMQTRSADGTVDVHGSQVPAVDLWERCVAHAESDPGFTFNSIVGLLRWADAVYRRCVDGGCWPGEPRSTATTSKTDDDAAFRAAMDKELQWIRKPKDSSKSKSGDGGSTSRPNS